MKTFLVLSTVPNSKTAARIARLLVHEKLAACVNIVPGLTSIYRWQGKMTQDRELLLVIKTTSTRYPILQKRIQSLHPYTVPEILAIPITRGASSYLQWIQSSVE